MRMDSLSILFHRIHLEEYPEYAACPRVGEQPGLVLLEARAMQGIRYATPMGYVLSLLYVAYKKKSLPVSQRSSIITHHYFFPSAGYAVPVGIACGLAYELIDARGFFTEQRVLERQARVRQRLVAEGCRLHSERAILVAEQARLCRPRWRWWLGSAVEAAAAEPPPLTTAAPPSQPRAFTRKPRHTGDCGRVDAAARLRAVEEEIWVLDREIEEIQKEIQRRLQSPQPAVAATAPSAHPTEALRYSRAQVNSLVDVAVQLRMAPDEDRWMRSAGRLGGYGMLAMLLTWNSGGMIFRMCMGLGLGVSAAAVVSGTKLDEQFLLL